jgi:hypothetical protein
MGPFEKLVKPIDACPEKCIAIHKIYRIVAFIEITKHFWGPEVLNCCVACINCWIESRIPIRGL